MRSMLGTSTPYGTYLAVLAPDNNGCAMAYDLVEPACCRKSWISCMRWGSDQILRI